MPPTAQFAIYRQYEASRQRANNAIVALLAGSALAAHTLKLTEGSDRLLPEIFPAVPHIERFNLRPTAAAAVIGAAGPHLATVTVPYALAIHEDFVKQCIDWLETSHGIPSTVPGNEVNAANMHETLASMTGSADAESAPVDLELFHLYRHLRNCHVHRGGRATTALHDQEDDLSPKARARWFDLTEREQGTLIDDGRAEYCLLDVFAIFAVTKELGRGVNRLLQTGLSPSQWAEACVDDYCRETARTPRSNAWGRGLIGYARYRYEVLSLDKRLLFEAAASKGMWPDARSHP